MGGTITLVNIERPLAGHLRQSATNCNYIFNGFVDCRLLKNRRLGEVTRHPLYQLKTTALQQRLDTVVGKPVN